MSSALKQAACDAIEGEKEALYAISRDLWEHPELGYEEVYAHAALTKFLEDRGYKVEKNFVVNTGFRTTVGSSLDGPHIAVLCEYDALPEIGHACGHNLIAEVGLAAGIGIKAAFEANEKSLGKLTILGTPAEEGGGGKIDMINAHVFDDVDVAMMAHPGHYNTPTYYAMAFNALCIKYYGRASHASAQPWSGLNALDAAVLAYQNISCLRQQIKPDWQIHGVIKNGGTKPNIIPELTELEYYIRVAHVRDMPKLREKVVACFQAAATATGCRVEITDSEEERPFADMVNNSVVSGLYLENAMHLGIDFRNHVQDDTGSTDMGNVSHVVPSIHPMFYIDKATYHTRDFTAVTGERKVQKYTLAVAKALALTAIDIYTNKEHLANLKEEFKRECY